MRYIALSVFTLIVLANTVSAQRPSPVLIGQKTETSSSFEIQGTITTVNDSSFIVRGELVAATSENMDRFKSNGLIDVGNFVTVKGEIKNNIMMAKQITKLGKNPEAGSDDMKKTQVEVITNPNNKSVVDGIINAIKNILFIH